MNHSLKQPGAFRLPRHAILLLGWLGVALAMWADQLLTSIFNYNFIETTFYLLPISIATWCAGPLIGTAVLVPALIGETYLNIAQIGDRPVQLLIGTTAFVATEMVAAVILITKLRSYVGKYHLFASIDELTGCLNARAFRHECELAIERMKRIEKSYLSVMYIDVDDFKLVNDLKGHRGGDHALRILGKSLMESVRVVDVVGRVGGDEFAVVLPGVMGGDLPVIIDRIQKALEAAEFPTTISIGYITYPPGVPKDIDEVFHQADVRMYEAKRVMKAKRSPAL